jgi:hypothetical protein
MLFKCITRKRQPFCQARTILKTSVPYIAYKRKSDISVKASFVKMYDFENSFRFGIQNGDRENYNVFEF